MQKSNLNLFKNQIILNRDLMISKISTSKLIKDWFNVVNVRQVFENGINKYIGNYIANEIYFNIEQSVFNDHS